MIEIAWKIISDFATEVLKSSTDEDNEDKEREDVLKAMEKKSSEALKHKRSFFVRMVSDPKLYNPKIVKVSLAAYRAEPLDDVPVDGPETENIQHGRHLGVCRSQSEVIGRLTSASLALHDLLAFTS